ncbi:MAG: hypothetical protein IPG50_14175 [Myxococcales bacterium]|nr:hypothetical protein [Myxococcales bacterium]
MRLSSVTLALAASATACQALLSFQERDAPAPNDGGADATATAVVEAGEADAAGDGGLLSDADVPVVTFCDTVDGAALCLDFEGPNALNKNVLGDAGVTLKGAGDGGIIVDKQDSNKFLEVDLAAGDQAQLAWSYANSAIGANASIVIQAKVEVEPYGYAEILDAGGYTYISFLTYVDPVGLRHQFVLQDFESGPQSVCAFRNFDGGSACLGLTGKAFTVELVAKKSKTVFSKTEPAQAAVEIGQLDKTSSDVVPSPWPSAANTARRPSRSASTISSSSCAPSACIDAPARKGLRSPHA